MSDFVKLVAIEVFSFGEDKILPGEIFEADAAMANTLIVANLARLVVPAMRQTRVVVSPRNAARFYDNGKPVKCH